MPVLRLLKRSITMKKYLILIILSSTLTTSAQEKDSIFIGKRKNFIWSREINERNLGDSRYTYYYPVFYKTSSNPNFRKVGFMGSRLNEYLKEDPQVAQQFKLYRLKKGISFAALPAAATCLTIWSVKGANEIINGHPNSFYSSSSLPWLAGYFIFFILGQKINTDADLNLYRAVTRYNAL